jgi:Lar family restriction alleviation protein
MARTMKNCPFCGCTKITVCVSNWLDERCVYVYCEECHVGLKRLGKNIREAKRKAVDAWNVRTHYTKEPYNERHTGKRSTG